MRILRIVLVILFILLVLSLFGYFIFGGKKSTKTETTETTNPRTSFTDAATTSATVSYVVDGVINSEEAHRAIRITISNTSRMLEVTQGYNGQVLSTQSFPNTDTAYADFLSAIYTTGFTSKRSDVKNSDMSGQCPLGYRYIFSSNNIPDVPQSLWTTSCTTINAKGTFGGNRISTAQLFQLQIPNYSKLVSGVKLN